MPVGDEAVAGIAILQVDPVLDRSEIVSEMHAARRTQTAENVLRLWIH
jgi:hypothetical protein